MESTISTGTEIAQPKKMQNAKVENLLYPGLTILVGPPKSGKSRMLKYILSSITKVIKVFNTYKSTGITGVMYFNTSDAMTRTSAKLQEVASESKCGLDSDKYAVDDLTMRDPEERLDRVIAALSNDNIHLIIVDSIEDLLGDKVANSKTKRNEALSKLRKAANDQKKCLLMSQNNPNLSAIKSKEMTESYVSEADNYWEISELNAQSGTTFYSFSANGKDIPKRQHWLKREDNSYFFELLKEKQEPKGSISVEQKVEIALGYNMPQDKIAIMIGTSQPTVSRMVNEIQAKKGKHQDILSLKLGAVESSQPAKKGRKKKGEMVEA